MIYQLYTNASSIWMICLEFNWFFTIRVKYCNILNFMSLLKDAIDRSKISSNHHRIYFDVSLYPLFFANTPFNKIKITMIKFKHYRITVKTFFFYFLKLWDLWLLIYQCKLIWSRFEMVVSCTVNIAIDN